VLSIVLARVPFFGIMFYPFHLFGTFIHEISHGLTAVLTGGGFHRFTVRWDLSGEAWTSGGIRWLIVSAGYVGSAIFGGFLTFLSARNISARHVLFWLGIIFGMLCLIFVRNPFGWIAGLLLAGLLVLAGEKLSAAWADGLLLFLAVQMMLDAIDSVFDLIWISTYRSDTFTDALIMQRATGIPSLIWATVWSIISLVVLVVSLSIAYRRTPAPLTHQHQPV
jgi:hypothetical protein